jgi:peptidoglycan/xylan/chitin deacetylase (PgdA/CDA1 family)
MILDMAASFSHVEITFDDGNVSDMHFAVPALQKRHLTATFFLCSGRLNQPTFVNAQQARELLAAGMEVGSHGVDHLPWRGLKPAVLWNEVQSSRARLEDICQRSVTKAACPFGEYDRRVLKAVRRAGYHTVLTSDDGVAFERQWVRSRTTITREMSMQSIKRLIERGPGLFRQVAISLRSLVKKNRLPLIH